MYVNAGSPPPLSPPMPEPAGAGDGLLAPGSLSRGAAAAAAAGIAAAAEAFRSVLVADPGLAGTVGPARAGGTGWTVSPSAADASEAAGYAPGEGASSQASTEGSSAALTAKSASAKGGSKSTVAKKSATTTKKTTTTTKKTTTSSTGEYAFLDDKKLSIEEKLFRFMKITQQKGDAELVGLMKNYRELHGTSARSASTGGTSAGGGATPAPKQDDGGGLFGFLGDVAGFVGDTVGAVGGAAAKLAGQAGGPLLAAAATALGQPELIPVALAIGGEVGKAVGGVLTDALGTKSSKPASSSSGSSSSSASSTASTSDAGSPDEKLDMLEIQRAVEKQNQMFTLISNILKSQHDTGMSEINNIR